METNATDEQLMARLANAITLRHDRTPLLVNALPHEAGRLRVALARVFRYFYAEVDAMRSTGVDDSYITGSIDSWADVALQTMIAAVLEWRN